ncbi:MAG TPA: carboxypeptidase-like regulatory domain-containing protein [Polyangiaceae bacterium]|nr:carboxypeptidase-like regulatory domain-containing protein [Polyangiaceae bacterium]
MRERRVHSAASLLFVASAATSLHAQTGKTVGDAPNALPGLHRVPVIGLSQAGSVHAALDAGYGMTEGLAREGAHHRVLGSVGLGLVPLRGIELGLIGRARYDRHPDDGRGTDSGTVGEASFVSRFGTRVGEALMLGADLGVSLPGSESWSERAKSLTVDARAVFGWVPIHGFRYVATGGFRFDNTGSAGADASQYRFGDRVALGLSDYHAVLLGAGLSIPMEPFELIGEVSGDLLIGTGAPPITQSPLRVDVGVRRALSTRLAAEFLTEVALSQRPDVGPTAPLVPIEPRLSLSLGLRYRWGADAVPDTAALPEPASAEEAPTAAATTPSTPVAKSEPATGRIRVSVFDEAGNPLSDAVVKLVSDSGERVLDFSQGSTYAGESLKSGRARVVVKAELMRDWEQAVEITKDGEIELRVTMLAAQNSGQIRGQVRSFNGANLPAHVRIDPGGHEVDADASGAFRLDLAPGKYRVRIEMDGYHAQERAVVIRKSGVIVLNVDMEKMR